MQLVSKLEIHICAPTQRRYLALLWCHTPIQSLTASSMVHHGFLSGLLSSSPCSLECLYRVLSYLIVSLKAFLSLSPSLEVLFKILDSIPRSILSHLQNLSCSTCSFQKFFFQRKAQCLTLWAFGLWMADWVGFEKSFDSFRFRAEQISWTAFLIYNLL
jgi:hypothetical protein